MDIGADVGEATPEHESIAVVADDAQADDLGAEGGQIGHHGTSRTWSAGLVDDLMGSAPGLNRDFGTIRVDPEIPIQKEVTANNDTLAFELVSNLF
jgi:hypothetical protein